MNNNELKKIEMKKDGKSFERFDKLFRQVINVPKDEINRRENAEKDKKEGKKKG